MNKKWVWIIILVMIVLGGLYYVFFQAPYNLMDKRHASSLGIINNKSLQEIPELKEYFKDIEVTKVKYLGQNTYEVLTDQGEFIIIADYSNSMYWNYKIFKYDKKVKYFINPM